MSERTETRIETDYLVIGAGAMGIAFADEILTLDPRAEVVMVDRRAQPGGHWVDAYDFVRLHQPAAYYGVNSRRLERDDGDLSSKPELLAYFNAALEAMLATGRLRFLSRAEYVGDFDADASAGPGPVRLRSLDEPDRTWTVTARRRLVDATYSQVAVPATRPPAYAVAEGAHLVPINGIAEPGERWRRFVVIGGGKTGIDAVLHLLSRGVASERIWWIVSADSWIYDRAHVQLSTMSAALNGQMRLVAQSETLDDVIMGMAHHGWWVRLDEGIEPTRFRCATVSKSELNALRTVSRVVRLGRVQRIEADRIVLDQGAIETGPDVLHVDCTACGLSRRPDEPVFSPGRLTLQPLMMCQQVMSAAFIACLDLHFDDDDAGNAAITPLPHPAVPADFVRSMQVATSNISRLMWTGALRRWVSGKRLSLMYHMTLKQHLHGLWTMLRWGRRAQRQLAAISEACGPRQALEHEAGSG